MLLARKAATTMIFGFWLIAGVALGMILMAFLAVGTYQRGYAEGYALRKPWHAELRARRLAITTLYRREPAPVIPYRIEAASALEALPRAASA
jgi:hypothetical protein